MNGTQVIELVNRAQQGDVFSREKLILQHKFLIGTIAGSICKRKLDWNNDDELSIALIAFNEAIETFDLNKGQDFMSYARTIIRHRLVDFFRKEAKNLHQSLDNHQDEQIYSLHEAKVAWDNYHLQREAAEREEIVRLYSQELLKYNISLKDLVASSPKHKDTKLKLIAVAEKLVTNPQLLFQLTSAKQLPVQELVTISGQSRKVIEKGRRYIIALALIMCKDEFRHLRSLIKFTDISQPGGELNG